VDRRHGDALRGPRQTAARNPATSCGPRADARPGPRALQLARVLLGDRKCRRTLRLVLVGREEAVAREASGRVTAEAGAGLPPGRRRRSRSSLAAAGRLLELPLAPRQSAARPRIAPARPGAWLERGPWTGQAASQRQPRSRCSLGRGLTAASTRPETHFSLYQIVHSHIARDTHTTVTPWLGLQSAHTMLIPTPGDSMRQSERNTCIVHRGRTRLAGRPRAYNASPRRRAARERSCGASTSRV